MVDKIFKSLYPVKDFIEFLKQACYSSINDDGTLITFVINIDVYKHMLFHNMIEQWYETLKPYYHLSKQYYLTRTLTFKHFGTVVRQISRQHRFDFQSKIKYSRSQYTTSYLIHIPYNLLDGWVPDKNNIAI